MPIISTSIKKKSWINISILNENVPRGTSQKQLVENTMDLSKLNKLNRKSDQTNIAEANLAEIDHTKINGQLITVPISFVSADPDQPRKLIDPDKIQELAATIRKVGIIQPIIVRPDKNRENHYIIIAGERRWRAAQIAELNTIQVIINLSKDRALIALIENTHDEPLNPIEQSDALFSLNNNDGYTHKELGQILGMSRNHITQVIRLQSLPDNIKDAVIDGTLTMGAAKVLCGCPDWAVQSVFTSAIEKDLSVRKIENLVRKNQAIESEGGPNHLTDQKVMPEDNIDPDIKRLESLITDHIGTRVVLKYNQKTNKTGLTILPCSLDVFDGILDKLGIKTD